MMVLGRVINLTRPDLMFSSWQIGHYARQRPSWHAGVARKLVQAPAMLIWFPWQRESYGGSSESPVKLELRGSSESMWERLLRQLLNAPSESHAPDAEIAD